MRRTNCGRFACWLAGIILLSVGPAASASELLIGTSTISITPDRPVNLAGQHRARIARTVDNPCTATAVALESRDGDRVLDQAIMVSCDLVAIRGNIQDQFRKKVASRLPGVDLKKIFLSATHTHTGPTMLEGNYEIPKDAMQPAEYVDFLIGRLGDLVVRAWESRKPGGVSWGLGHAVVAHNRRAVYADGSAKMYGKTTGPDFRTVEGPEDHGVEVLFFWDKDKRLVATAVNVACPSQEVEGISSVNADFWNDVRIALRKAYGENLCVLGWAGAAGDQSPHLLWRKEAEERMREKRVLTRMQEIARRIAQAVAEAYEVAEKDVRFDAPLVHAVEDLKLPVRRVSDEEFAAQTALVEELKKKKTPGGWQRIGWYQRVLDRYESQKTNPFYGMELHVVRLGDVAIATNPFELYTDYGIQMKARSKAQQTFVIQLACTSGKYLPTAEAIRRGSYSTEVNTNLVGPEGGQVLVDQTVERINALWPAEKK